MKNLKTILISTLLLSQVAFADNNKYKEGEKLYKTNCAVCHGTTGGMDMGKRVAPPVIAIRMHYIKTYSDEDSFVTAVSEWVEKPEEERSMMRGAIRKFNLMPAISIPKEDAEKIAAYIYAGDLESPEGYQKHYEKKHGKKGKKNME